MHQKGVQAAERFSQVLGKEEDTIFLCAGFLLDSIGNGHELSIVGSVAPGDQLGHACAARAVKIVGWFSDDLQVSSSFDVVVALELAGWWREALIGAQALAKTMCVLHDKHLQRRRKGLN